jgi:hypothetical protein
MEVYASGCSWSANDICGYGLDGNGGKHTIQFYKKWCSYIDSAIKHFKFKQSFHLFIGMVLMVSDNISKL